MVEAELKSLQFQIGLILRAYREKTARNLTVVAESAGISTSMLSQIERGVTAPSIDTLFGVCEALGFDLAELFRRVSHRETVRIQKQRDRLTTESGGIRYEQLVASADSAHPAEMFLLEVQPSRQVGLGGKGHEGVEMGYVLSGKAKLAVGTKQYEIGAGDSISFAAHLPHRLENHSEDVFTAIWTVLPPHRDYLELDEEALFGHAQKPRRHESTKE